MIDNDFDFGDDTESCGCQLHIQTPCGCELHAGCWIQARCEHGRIWLQGDRHLIECDASLSDILGETEYCLVRVSGRADSYDRD